MPKQRAKTARHASREARLFKVLVDAGCHDEQLRGMVNYGRAYLNGAKPLVRTSEESRDVARLLRAAADKLKSFSAPLRSPEKICKPGLPNEMLKAAAYLDWGGLPERRGVQWWKRQALWNVVAFVRGATGKPHYSELAELLGCSEGALEKAYKRHADDFPLLTDSLTKSDSFRRKNF